MDFEIFDLTEAVVAGVRDPSLCGQMAQCIRATGCLAVRDPRVSEADNDRFLDLLERYFAQPREKKAAQIRSDLHYQVGLVPAGVEVPEAMHEPNAIHALEHLSHQDRPQTPRGPDPKSRYMWRIGPRPENTAFYELNAEPVVPPDFPEWEAVLNSWGEKLLATVVTVGELLSLGFGWGDPSMLTGRMEHGPHMLAPTGVDVALHTTPLSCIAGYHADLNLLTAHGKSRYPGLYVWLRDGRRVAAKVPSGCILIQAGMQLERLTGEVRPRAVVEGGVLGGYVRAGMHEVVVSEETLAALESAEGEGRSSWRVSSTLFGHIASDVVLAPLGKFCTAEALAAYPPVLAGDYVAGILRRLKLYDTK